MLAAGGEGAADAGKAFGSIESAEADGDPLRAFVGMNGVDLDMVRGFDRFQSASGVTGLAAGFASAFLPQAAGRGFLQAVAGGRLAAISAVLGESSFQLADFLLECQDALNDVLWFAPGLGQKLRSTQPQNADP